MKLRYLYFACFFPALMVAALPQWLAAAREFPTRPVRLVVPFSPGATVDVAARMFAARLASYWDQPVIVENRPGAATTIGARFVAQSHPDGYTLLLSTSDTFTVVPHLPQYRSFQPATELVAIMLLATLVNAIVVNPNLPVSTLPELIGLARAHPGALRYGSPGIGTNVHLAMEMLKVMAQIDMQHVPYRGLAPATTAVLTNEVQVGQAGYSARDLIASGRLRAIAVAGTERLPAFADIATTAELGFGKVNSSTWLTISGPAKTPREALEKINNGLSLALNDPATRQELVERFGLAIMDVGLDAATTRLERRSQDNAEMVELSGADRE